MIFRDVTSWSVRWASKTTKEKAASCVLGTCLDHSSSLKMEAVCSSKTLANFYNTARRDIPPGMLQSLMCFCNDAWKRWEIYIQMFGRKPKVKWPMWRRKRRLMDNTKIDRDVNWIYVTEKRTIWGRLWIRPANESSGAVEDGEILELANNFQPPNKGSHPRR
jgi:hypothetical protein